MNEQASVLNENPKSSLQKCISVLEAAKNDTERFAALLLVTQLVQSNAIDGAERRQLFDAIGFNFLTRLLNTRNVPSECPQDVYSSLALAILACFSTDEELREHPEMLKKIPLFLAGISESSNEATISDCYEIIASIACGSNGCKELAEKGAFSTLSRVFVGEKDGKYSAKAIELLLRILNKAPRVFWKEQSSALFEALNVLSAKFKLAQDSEKFELCRYLVVFLSSAEKSAFQDVERGWLGNIYKALNDVLQSKISSEQRDPAILLTSAVIDLVGMEWMIEFSGQETPGLFILSLTIASLEIRMILDDKTTGEILPKASVLCSCFNIMENAINFAIVKAGNSQNNKYLPNSVSEGLPRVYSIATESIQSIVQFLDHVAQLKDKGNLSIQENHVLLASVRVLCAWLAEETSALQDEICKLLPFLLKMGKESLATITEHATNVVSAPNFDDLAREGSQNDLDIVRFLLPPFCHFSADERTRKILLENDGLLLLSEYFFHQWKLWIEDRNNDTDSDDLETCLVTLLNIFLNIIVTEPQLATNDQTFQKIIQHAVTSTSLLISAEKNVVMLVNLIVLGLMFIRNHAEAGSMPFGHAELSVFLKDSIYVLKEAKCFKPYNEDHGTTKLATKCKEAWEDISELWFLGLQVLSALTSPLPLVQELLTESGWTEMIQAYLNSQAQELSGDEKDVLVEMLQKVSDL